MIDNTNRRSGHASARIMLCTALSCAACVIEKIDAIIAEHGVTYWPLSSGDEILETSTAGTSTSTSASTSTSTGSSTDSETGGQSGTLDSSAIADLGADDASDGSSSSGIMEPLCGDGVVQGDETCDDGNATPGDGCQECAKDSIVFISSESYKGYALEGLYGADQRCRSLAAKARLPRFETFRAWLSTPSMAAADRLVHSRGRYILVNGLVVAQNWDALTSGALENPIVVDENSQTQDGFVWTGTLVDGQPALGSEFCGEWKETKGFLIFGGEGLSLAVDSSWSFLGQGDCGTNSHIYCIEQ